MARVPGRGRSGRGPVRPSGRALTISRASTSGFLRWRKATPTACTRELNPGRWRSLEWQANFDGYQTINSCTNGALLGDAVRRPPTRGRPRHEPRSYRRPAIPAPPSGPTPIVQSGHAWPSGGLLRKPSADNRSMAAAGSRTVSVEMRRDHHPDIRRGATPFLSRQLFLLAAKAIKKFRRAFEAWCRTKSPWAAIHHMDGDSSPRQGATSTSQKLLGLHHRRGGKGPTQ